MHTFTPHILTARLAQYAHELECINQKLRALHRSRADPLNMCRQAKNDEYSYKYYGNVSILSVIFVESNGQRLVRQTIEGRPRIFRSLNTSGKSGTLGERRD